MTDETQNPNSDRLLSVVIVTYNEEDRIRECLDSVLEASRCLADVEVVLVDSNSTDRTVDIAREYPITVLRIPDDDLTTPGAGRYVGTNATRGDLVLFVDGDMVIRGPWLERAIETLRSSDDVAAVDGLLDDPSRAGETARSERTTEVDAVRGVALYRRKHLESVGGFDPYLKSLEDIHLGFQLTAAGYTLLRRPEVAATHPSRQSLSEPFRRWRRGYSIGPGQALRRSVGSPSLFGKHLYRIRYRLTLAVWICLGVGSLAFPPALVLWLVGSLLGGGVLAANRGITGAVEFLLGKTLGIVGLVQGVMRTPNVPETFPMDAVETVQQGSILTASPSEADPTPPD